MLPVRWKTYLAASLAAFCAFNHCYPVVDPDLCNAIMAAAAAIGVVGLSHDVPKVLNGNYSNGKNGSAKAAAVALFLLAVPQVAWANPDAACRVETKDAAGRPLTTQSGTVVAVAGDQAVVLTAAHGFFDRWTRPLPVATVECYFSKQRSLHGARIINVDREADLAALEITAAHDTVCVPVADNEPRESVSAVYHGHPNGVWPLRSVTAYYHGGFLARPSIEGDSGAGVIVNGQLVAMVQATSRDATLCCRCQPIRRWLRERCVRRVAWLDQCLAGS